MPRRLTKRLPRTRGGPPSAAVSSGSVGWGAGGPLWLDEFRSKRPPSPSELVNAYKAVAYACVQLNAQGVARVPLRLYARTGRRDAPPRRDVRAVGRPAERHLRSLAHVRAVAAGDDRIDEVMEHPFLEALRRPCPHWDGSMLLQYLVACLDVVGSAFLYPVRPDPTWAASEWWPLQAQYVIPVKGTEPGQVVGSWRFFGEAFGPDELVWFRTVSLRDPYMSGFAPLHACFEQAGLSNYYTATVESMLKNGARPAGAFVPSDPKMPPGDPERRRFESDVNGHFGGPRQGRIMVTNGAYTWQPIGWPPRDLADLEITKSMRLLAANCFGTPISLLQTEDSNRSVAESGNYQHQRNGVAPRCVAIAAGLTAMAQQVDPRLFFAFDDPVEADEHRDARISDIRLKNGTLTVNEDRAELGLPPVEGGDEPMVAGTLKRLRDAAADPPPPPPAPGPDGTPAPGPDGQPDGQGEGEPKPEADAEDASRALMAEALELLREIRADRPGPGRRDAGPAPQPAAGEGAGPGEGAGQHLWAADGGDDPEGPDPVAEEATEAGPGDHPDDRDGAAGELPAPDGGLGPDGPGDDAADLGLLGRGGEADTGAGGAGPGRVDGDEPAHPGGDPGAGPCLLPEHEPDDQPATGDGPAGAEAGAD